MTTQISEIIFLIIVLTAAGIGAFNIVKNKLSKIETADDLIDLLMNDVKENLIPFITKLALKEELHGCFSYTEFKAMCNSKFSTQLYDFLLIVENQESFNIPEKLKKFITKENINIVMSNALELAEVDELLYNTYINLVNESYRRMEEFEKETAAINAEIGVEDETTLQKEDLGLTREDEDQNNLIDIGGELNSSVDDKDLIEVVEE